MVLCVEGPVWGGNGGLVWLGRLSVGLAKSGVSVRLGLRVGHGGSLAMGGRTWEKAMVEIGSGDCPVETGGSDCLAETGDSDCPATD